MTDIERIDAALAAVRAELIRATALHGSFRSSHEGFGVIAEEFDEFWDEVKANNSALAIEEVTQLAAMATRFIVDLSEHR